MNLPFFAAKDWPYVRIYTYHVDCKNDILYLHRCALYRMNVLHVTAKPQVVYRTVLWIVNYKITVKSALSREGGHLRQIRELKIKKNWRKRSILLYKLHLKAANLEQTNTHTNKVSTVTLVRMRAER